MKTIRKLSLTLATIFALTACSPAAEEAKKEEKAKNNETSIEESSQTNEKSSKEGPVEIQFWYGLGSVAGETMEGIIDDFNKSQDEVKVTGVQQADYTETYQKVQAAIAANKPPAVYISETMVQQAQAGILTDLSKYLDSSKVDLGDYLDVFMNPAKIDGKVYAIPAYGTTQVMYYRKDLLDKAGIDPKDAFSSWEKVYETSKTMQEKNITKWGHLPMWGKDNLVDLALSNGGKILSDDGKKVLINSTEWVDAWDFIRKQINDNKTCMIESGGEGWEYWYRTIDDVMNGDAMSYTGSSGDKGNLDFSKIDSAKQPGLNGNKAKPIAVALYLAVPKKTSEEQKKAACKWIEYFTSPENSAFWSQKIGYIPVRKSAMEVESYKKFTEENPYAKIPYEQALTASPAFIDPTDGKISDALSIAADKIELQNIPAKDALDEACKTAQEALDKVNNK
ncbi:MAG: ABC transporter substrate-binding protein [Peptoniphilaceae bacterium]|nr:ABC transporter substrate-binding protein [Peptoniphilaceae bacterium]MDY6018186.1 ABC transporter substrate-binding protein [Anaerococcus sp.]